MSGISRPSRVTSVAWTSHPKWASGESGDVTVALEHPEEGVAVVFVDVQGTGHGSRRTGVALAGLGGQLAQDGVAPAVIAMAMNDVLTSRRHGRVSATVGVASVGSGGRLMLARYGAIAGAIRRGADTELLPFPAQPAGMETGCEPLTYSCEMDDDCWLVLVSDGIADRPGQLAELLDGCSFVDGEALARAIVDTAVRRDGGRAKGDMTAVVATSRRAEAGSPVTRCGYVSVVTSPVPQWRRA